MTDHHVGNVAPPRQGQTEKMNDSTKNVMYFTEKEEEFANLLIEIGTKRNVAKVLVFLANIPEATSREIERGTDLRQPEVSIAMGYLMEQGWDADQAEEECVSTRDVFTWMRLATSRSVRGFRLAMPGSGPGQPMAP
jgi:predicted transcriptional regulator